MLAKAGAYFLPIAVPLVCKYVSLLNWKSLRSNVSSSRVRINLSGLFFAVLYIYIYIYRERERERERENRQTFYAKEYTYMKVCVCRL